MNNILVVLFIFGLSFVYSHAQTKIEEDIETAYQNARKGIYWALENIPEKKVKLENDLIAEDRLFAAVELEKQVNGIKIESTGFYYSNSVTIIIYKSEDALIEEGYLKK